MRGETLTRMVREAVHSGSGHSAPADVAALMQKCALFNPARTAILHANATFGTVWKAHGESTVTLMRDKEKAAATPRPWVVSWEGVNALMREQGKKRGRK